MLSDIATSPRAPAIFVGRSDELARLRSALERLRLAVIYGVPGVGKSSLLLHAATELSERHGARLVYRACDAGESVPVVAAAVLGGAVRGEPIDALITAARRQPLVLALDDAHHATGVLLDAVQYLAHHDLPLWILLASRRALALSPVTLDHALVRLAPFDAEQAAVLWRELSLAYGPPPMPLAEVARAGATTPLRLKQAFAGPATPRHDDPLGLGSLPAPARAVLAQLVAFRRPVPLAAAQPTDGLAALEARFLIERTEGRLFVHDLVRAAVNESAQPPGPAEHARALAWWRAHADDDEGAVEQLHHAIQVGEIDAALQILERHSLDMERMPPGVAVSDQHLADALDQVAALVPLSRNLRFLRALIRSHQGESRRAFDEMRALSEDDDRGLLAFGAIGVALGRLDAAAPALERVRDATDVSMPKRLMALACLAGGELFQGNLARAQRVIEGGAPLYDALGMLGVGSRAWLRGVLALEREEPARAARALADARTALAPLSEMLASLPLVDSVERTVQILLGNAAPSIAAGDLFGEKPFFRHAARLLRLQEDVALGHLRQASALGESLVGSAHAIGYPRLEQAARVHLAEADRALGRLSQARAHTLVDVSEWTARGRARLSVARARLALQAGEVAAARAEATEALRSVRHAPATRARLHAIVSLASAIAGSRTRLPRPARPTSYEMAQATLDGAEALLWQDRLDEIAPATAAISDAAGVWRQLHARATLLDAEVAFRTGDLHTAASRLRAMQPAAHEAGWSVEATRAALLGASLARARGEDARAQQLLNEALTRAEAEGLTIEAGCARVALGRARSLPANDAGTRLAARLQLSQPLPYLLRDSEGAWFVSARQLARLDRTPHDLFVDLVARRARIGRRRVDFGRRRMLLELVRLLCERPGQVIPVEDITRAVWQVDYHPLRHHGRITMAVSRLRQLFGAGVVEAEADGYRLRTIHWAVLDRRPA